MKVSVNGRPAGSRQLTYYSMSADVVSGLSQIYLQQLMPLLDALLLRCDPPRLLGADDVDRLLIRLFDDDDDDSTAAGGGGGGGGGRAQIPPQAFEQLFGVYTQAVSGTRRRDAELARHASRWMPLKWKTLAHFPYFAVFPLNFLIFQVSGNWGD